MSIDEDEVAALLPLPEATFHVLVALSSSHQHGYAILQDVEQRTGGAARLSAGTLYRALHRMLEQGLVVESDRRPAREQDDERRRYYRITPLGAAAVRAESRRLARLVELARAKGLAPRRA